MKLHSTLMAVASLVTLAATAQAQTVTGTGVDADLSTMPGSALDYSFYGTSGQFTNGDFVPNGFTSSTLEPQLLLDFTESGGSTFAYIQGGGTGNASINVPESAIPTVTGSLFGGGGGVASPDVVNYQILSTSGSDFNVSDFNVYVMFDNYPSNANGVVDKFITLGLTESNGSALSSGSETVTSFSAFSNGLSAADFAVFEVKGASAGDILQVGYQGNDAGRYGGIGGISFESAPEPSTYAMMLAGLAVLGFCVRRKLA